ncbi:hypothetical protein [Patulibacter sp.]|uniref:hypothetical protein n=1 Tax=Patulibacter sp. TaxID=1912859 RepID=UPI00271AE74D|nr:hypothetical protein [Patulibacter sp.]MDO9408118.1 hypothetical protein [Patulibacter sp.]
MHLLGQPRTVLLLAVVSVVGPLAAAVPASAAKAPKRCSALHGRDLVPGNPRVRVVRVRVADRSRTDRGDGVFGHEYYGCTTPGSRVRSLGDAVREVLAGSAVGSTRFSLGHSAGTWLVVRSGYGTLMGDGGATRRVVDVATGRGYTFWESDSEREVETALPPVAATALDASGRLVAIFAGESRSDASDLPTGATVGVASFAPDGRRTILDSGGAEIVPRSLRLTGTVASWTHGAGTRTIDLATGATTGRTAGVDAPGGTAAAQTREASVAPARDGAGVAARSAADVPRGLRTGRPVDCGPTRSGTYRMLVSRPTGCRFARATYEAFRRDLEGGRELVSGVGTRYVLAVRDPARRRTVRLDVRAIARAHGEFDFTFVRRSANRSLAFENLTLP